MSAAVAGLLSAFANALGAILSKDLAGRYPARQLIGPLFALNCLLVLPAAPFVVWRWSPEIIAIPLVSAVLLAVSAYAIWDLYDAAHPSVCAGLPASAVRRARCAPAAPVPTSHRPPRWYQRWTGRCPRLIAQRDGIGAGPASAPVSSPAAMVSALAGPGVGSGVLR